MSGPHSTLLTKRETPGPGDKMRRAGWRLVWLLLYRPSPNLLVSWRRLLLRLFGAKIADDTHPYPGARIWAPWNLTMHERSCLADGANCYNVARVSLGPRTIVSQGAYLCTATHDYNSSAFELMVGEINVEEDCWVATEAFVGPGVTLRRGSVVLARAVVVRDVPNWSVVAGNPAREVAPRTAQPREIPR